MITFALLRTKITAARRAQIALEEIEKALDDVAADEAIFRAVAQHANDGLLYQDMEARIIWANSSYCRTMGYDLEEIVGRKPQEFCFPPQQKPSRKQIEAFRFDPNDDTFKTFHRHPNIRKNGERFWHEFSQAVVEPRPGEQRVVLVSRDVTQQVQRESELEDAKTFLTHAADHDALTGLLNRAAFLRRADEVLGRPSARDRQMGLICIDLDHFKAINDSNGHAVGDQILIHVAEAMKAAGSGDAINCRMGGDEFVMAIPGIADFDTLQVLADNLLERIRTPIDVYETTLTCNASIGLALGEGAPITAEDLIRSADFALYEAKVPGAPSIARYDADLHERQVHENAMMEEFVDALDNDGITFQHQPILDGRTGKIRSFETLARWTRTNGERVPPDRFLPFAARINRMTDVDFAAVRATASLVADLRARGHKILGAFNTSSEALAHPDFLTRLEEEARIANLSPDHMIAEVLETTFFGADTTDSVAAARINQLREKGYTVYLDDFGVGYAGLAHLGQLNVSGVKLDRSLIANVTSERSARIITTSILRLCHTLGVGTLAEGIETREQAEFLLKHGCYRLQGFGIARPMSRAALIDFVEQGAEITILSEHDRFAQSA
ncbi:putative bifunctional diguanylate cyclase/phosphodiesterase [Gymnodinialimonas hymeniacidonis]|uniref:putative bifunctional diguanylate cyclase/phosphodiesterase n=1 Tax=Gymnodinialimonas hymeniacidonis TaxID=3126508 RepID=UPI0034C5F1DD